MRDRGETHAPGDLRCEGGALPRSTEKDKSLVLRKDALVIRAFRIDPELQHAARAMEGARYSPFALELANVAQIDQHHVVPAMQCNGLAGGYAFNFALRRFDQFAN